MNKRILELALKAAEGSSWKPGLGNEHVQEYFQGFAELIVKECAKEAFEFWCYQVDSSEESAQSHIKKHFGVE